MGDVYDLVTTAKKKLPNCKLVLCGVLRRRDVSWRRTGGLTVIIDAYSCLGHILNEFAL
jgi:hypothetical protein